MNLPRRFSHNKIFLRRGDNIREAGFSLLELIIVVFIVGIVAVFGRQMMSSSDAKLKAAARNLYSNLQRTRVEAIKTGSTWAIQFQNLADGDKTNDSYVVCQWDVPTKACTGTITTVPLTATNSVPIYFGYGDPLITTKNVSGSACPANCSAHADYGDGITYNAAGNANVIIFSSKGLLYSPSYSGYAYLQNDKNTVFAVGTGSLAGVVTVKKWVGTTWQ